MNPLKNIISVGFFTLYFLSSNFSNSFASEHKNKIIEFFSDIDISGQATVIYQTSSLDLNASGLKNKNNNLLNESELKNYAHKNYDGSVSSDVILEKRFNEDDFFQIDFQFAYGLGVDTNLQGGSMVNNDIMEDEDDRNKIYIAKAFYEKTFDLNDKYKVTFDIGKFGVNDFFDIGEENSDQTKQFLNQAIANNGAFDYVQDLNGRGYTYGFRAGIFNDFYGFDFGFFSSDAILKNISEKNSIIGAFKLTPKFNDLKGLYQFYIFSNKGEYADSLN